MAFAKLGMVDYEEKIKKVPDVLEPMTATKKIYHDGRQYSCKLPIDMLEEYWVDGDALYFERTRDHDGKINITVQYVRGKTK